MISIAHLISFAKRGILNYILKRPFCISFEITHSCNAKCKHCHRGGEINEKRAEPQKFGEICRTLKPVVAEVSGGEPLLRDDVEEIVKALKISKSIPFIILVTNGALLTKEKYLKLRKAGINEFSISLDYPDERHDEFRGIPGLFKHIKTLIEGLKLENKCITLCCVIQRDNFRELIKMVELARKWNVKINFSTYTWLRTNNKDYMISSKELDEFREIIKNLLKFKNQKIIYTSSYVFNKMVDFFKNSLSPRCRTGERFINVNPDGTFSPCGLIIKNYKTQKELVECFAKNNDCKYCYTSIRANTEKPLWYLIKDNIL